MWRVLYSTRWRLGGYHMVPCSTMWYHVVPCDIIEIIHGRLSPHGRSTPLPPSPALEVTLLVLIPPYRPQVCNSQREEWNVLAIVSVALNGLAGLDLTCIFLTQALFFRRGLSHMQVQGPLTACYSFLRGGAGVAAEAGAKAAAERTPRPAVVASSGVAVASSGGAHPVGSTGGPADSVGVMARGAEEPAAGANVWWANQAYNSEAGVGSPVVVAGADAAAVAGGLLVGTAAGVAVSRGMGSSRERQPVRPEALALDATAGEGSLGRQQRLASPTYTSASPSSRIRSGFAPPKAPDSPSNLPSAQQDMDDLSEPATDNGDDDDAEESDPHTGDDDGDGDEFYDVEDAGPHTGDDDEEVDEEEGEEEDEPGPRTSDDVEDAGPSFPAPVLLTAAATAAAVSTLAASGGKATAVDEAEGVPINTPAVMEQPDTPAVMEQSQEAPVAAAALVAIAGASAAVLATGMASNQIAAEAERPPQRPPPPPPSSAGSKLQAEPLAEVAYPRPPLSTTDDVQPTQPPSLDPSYPVRDAGIPVPSTLPRPLLAPSSSLARPPGLPLGSPSGSSSSTAPSVLPRPLLPSSTSLARPPSLPLSSPSSSSYAATITPPPPPPAPIDLPRPLLAPSSLARPPGLTPNSLSSTSAPTRPLLASSSSLARPPGLPMNSPSSSRTTTPSPLHPTLLAPSASLARPPGSKDVPSRLGLGGPT